MATVRRTALARSDYLEIFLFIDERNLPAAERLLRVFDQKLEMLAEMPGPRPCKTRIGKRNSQLSHRRLSITLPFH